MSMPAARIGSLTTGHGCWPPTIVAAGAPTVIAQGLPASFVGAPAMPHTCTRSATPPTHPLMVAMGSSSVIVQGMPGARIGDFMSCTDIIAMGAPTVITG